MHGLRHKRLAGRTRAAPGGSSQETNDAVADSQMSIDGGDDSNAAVDGNILHGEEPPKKGRGRGKRNRIRTQMKVPPHEGKVMLRPAGNR